MMNKKFSRAERTFSRYLNKGREKKTRLRKNDTDK